MGNYAAQKPLKLRLRPITPIHVWSGVRGVVGLDVLLEGNQCCVVDLGTLKLSLDESMAVLERKRDYGEVLAEARRSGRLGCKRRPYLEARNLGRGGKVLLLNDLLVPGSTIKGYIRTVVLNYLLERDLADKGKTHVENVLRSCVDLYAEPKNVSMGLEATYFRAPRPEKEGGFVDSFQELLVSDPLVPPNARTSVREAQVYDVAGNRVATAFLETFDEGELSYEVRVLRPAEQQLSAFVQYYRSRGAANVERVKEVLELHSRVLELYRPDRLLEVLRAHAKHVIREELGLLEKARSALRSRNVDVSAYEELLRNRVRGLLEGRDSRCAPARLGLMASHISKTIDGFLREHYSDLYAEVANYMTSRIRRAWDLSSVKLASFRGSYYGLGWAEVCVE
ncbi:MAG: hypothetical protein ABWK00_01430 [Desulfurococcaceae archaeon]